MKEEGMQPLLLDPEEAAAVINGRIDSHEWWVFVGPSHAMVEVEETFYSGKANADFEIYMGPTVGYFKEVCGERKLLALAFAHKRRMSAEQLHGLLVKRGAPCGSVAELEKRDILELMEV
jgi:hypothetical protein